MYINIHKYDRFPIQDTVLLLFPTGPGRESPRTNVHVIIHSFTTSFIHSLLHSFTNKSFLHPPHASRALAYFPGDDDDKNPRVVGKGH